MKRQPRDGEASWTIVKILKWATPYFQERGIDSPRATAELLLADVLDLARLDLYLQFDRPLSAGELAAFKTRVKRRVAGEPVAYIVGMKGFWKSEFAVSPDVLVPRPDTELLLEKTLSLLPEEGAARVLELGTGSGALILSVAMERRQAACFASDLSCAAALQARANANAHDLSGRVSFVVGHWFDPFRAQHLPFDLILSNPPYIPTADIDDLQPEIREYEPKSALDGGLDGLDCLRHIIGEACHHLKPSGHLLLEMGHDQRKPVADIIESCGLYEEVHFFDDYGGNNRIVVMKKKSP